MLTIAGLTEIRDHSSTLFDCGYLAAGSQKLILSALDKIIKKMRPHLIPVVEARGVYDIHTPSSIGNYYGDIYETQLELARNCANNRADRLNGGVP